jgi:hypothetical protein
MFDACTTGRRRTFPRVRSRDLYEVSERRTLLAYLLTSSTMSLPCPLQLSCTPRRGEGQGAAGRLVRLRFPFAFHGYSLFFIEQVLFVFYIGNEAGGWVGGHARAQASIRALRHRRDCLSSRAPAVDGLRR